MPRNHKDNNLFSIDLEAIERVLEDANSPMLSQAEQIISKAIEYPNEINENAEAEEVKLSKLGLEKQRIGLRLQINEFQIFYHNMHQLYMLKPQKFDAEMKTSNVS